MTYKHPFIIGGAVISLLLISIGHATPNQAEYNFNVQPGGTLHIDSDSGSVEVESHSKNTVEVQMEKKGSNSDDFEVNVTQNGNDVKVVGERKGSRFSSYSLNVRYTIKVPSNYNMQIETGGGSIELSDLTGRVDARTSGGSIELGRIIGDVDVKTSGGSIRVDDVAGNIDAHTSGGSIRATISKQPSEDSRLSTSGGSVTAYLAKEIAVDVNASTSGGRVKSDFDVDGTVKKTRITGKINGGGPKLTLKTSGGSVRIKEL